MGVSNRALELVVYGSIKQTRAIDDIIDIYIYIVLCNHNAMLNIMYITNYDFICIIDTTYIHTVLWQVVCAWTYHVLYIYTHIDVYIMCMYVKLCHKCTHVFAHTNQCYTCPYHSDVSPEDVVRPELWSLDFSGIFFIRLLKLQDVRTCCVIE